MGLDVSLYKEPFRENVERTSIFEAHVTHNLKGLWEELGIFEPLYRVHHQRAGSLVKPLKEALLKLKAEPETYTPMTRPDWGSYAWACEFLEDVCEAYEKHPDAYIGLYS